MHSTRRKKGLKYKNIKVEYKGIKFDSKKELKRYTELELEQRAGLITGLELQPEFPFIIDGKPVKHNEKGARPLKYVADFRYFRDGVEIIEDTKSSATASDSLFRLKKALFETIYDKTLTIT